MQVGTTVNFTKEQRREMGKLGREYVLKNYNFETFNSSWVDLMLKLHEEEGSWSTRKYNGWSIEEIV